MSAFWWYAGAAESQLSAAEFVDTPTFVQSVNVPAFSVLPYLWTRRKLSMPAADSGIITGVVLIDADTIYVDIQTSSVELAEFVDTNEVYVNVQLSSVELAEFVDVQEVYVDIQLSSVETAEYVETSTVYLDIQIDTADIAELIDTDTVYVDIQASGTEFVESIATPTYMRVGMGIVS